MILIKKEGRGVTFVTNGWQVAAHLRRPSSSFFTKRYHRVFSGSLWSTSTVHGRNEVCRQKAFFLPSLKRLIERPHRNVVSYCQKTTDRPLAPTMFLLEEDIMLILND